MPFTPFDKPLDAALTPDDLQLLVARQVAEGYYVEYKGAPPANEKIGKSIASLANTYGGWYIVGVTTDAHNVATAVDGFDPATWSDPIARVRDVVKSHITPLPVFYAQVVTLASANLVVVVYVPDGQDTPFITLDGRIYRRAHDSSEPVAEKDRYAVDRIVDRGKTSQSAFARFCRDERGTSARRMQNDSWVGVYMWPYPTGVIEYRFGIDTEQSVAELLLRSQQAIPLILPKSDGSGAWIQGSSTVPFSAGHLTHRSIVLQQVDKTNLGQLSLTLELFLDGRAKIFLPLPLLHPIENGVVAGWVQTTSVERVLRDHLQHDLTGIGIRSLTFFDTEKFWGTLATLVNFYRIWLGASSMLSGIKFGATMRGVWRTVPFLDTDEWGSQADTLGLPVVSVDEMVIPENIEQGIIRPCDDYLWFHVCTMLGQALGFSRWMLAHSLLDLITRQQTP